MKKGQTSKTIRFHAIEGVYYIKTKVDDVPNDQPTACEHPSCAMKKKPEDFPRRGR